MYEDKDYETIDAMEAQGGSFVVGLANAARHADPFNFIRLKKAFPEIWNEYGEIAKAKKDRTIG